MQIKILEEKAQSTPKNMRNQKNYQQLKAELTTRKNKLNNVKTKLKNDFENVVKVLNYLKDILPNSTFIIGNDFIAPLKPDFLREQGKELSFKYGNSSNVEINLLGKITGKITGESLPDLEEDFFKIHKLIYFVLEKLELTKKGDLIISPVAIYFE